jgi:hypothetical protein
MKIAAISIFVLLGIWKAAELIWNYIIVPFINKQS